jgi:hypothetical protein
LAKRRTKEEQEKKRLLSQGYFECSSCGTLLKPKSRRCGECGTLTYSTKRAIYAVAVVAILVTASILVYTYYPREEEYKVLPRVVDYAPSGYGASTGAQISVTFNKAMDISSVEASFSVIPAVAGSFSWTGTTMTYSPSGALMDQTYYAATVGQGARDMDGSQLDCVVFSWSFITGAPPTTRRDVGTGAEDFWITYPATHPSSGSAAQHPDWVQSALNSGVVMILDHSEGCAPCIQQGSICQSISSANPDITYIDLSSGTDEPEASEGFAAYDPNGGIHYVPLTIVVTRILSPSGGTVIGWHAWEGVIDQSSLQGWISDAKSHYDENS